MKKPKNYSLARITQPVVILALFLIFLKLFAWDAWARFSRDDVQVQMRKEEGQTLNTPAITICMDHEFIFKERENHWDTNHTVWYQNICNRTLETANQFYDCINNLTYKQTEIIKGIMTYTLKNSTMSLRNTDWVETIRYLAAGKCFTSRTFGAVGEMDSDMVQLNSSYGYRVFFHDPDVFFVSFNPSGLPRIYIGIDTKLDKMAAQYLRAKKHILLDRASSPCQTDGQYSLISCIEMKIVRDSGCKLKWTQSPKAVDYPPCETFDEVDQHLRYWESISNSPQETIIRVTGCNMPCRYTEYVRTQDLFYRKAFFTDLTVFGFAFSTGVVEVHEEVLVYPFESFLAEVGGALGLFLGFSFIMIWDFILYIGKWKYFQ